MKRRACVLSSRYLPHGPALTELLAGGEVDLALGFSTAEDIRHHELEEIDWFEDEYVVISHTCRTALTLADYRRAPSGGHAVETKSRGCWIYVCRIRLYPADSAQNPLNA